MRVLLTGGSSFTGLWFARALAAAGHQVTATCRCGPDDYHGVRATRVAELARVAEVVWRTEFGDARLLDLAAARDFDVLAHHAAEMTDYRQWTFDSIAALGSNTRNARPLLERMAERGCRRLLLSGSVFEPFEGVGDPDQRAFNPYGLSKHMTFEWFRLEAGRLGLAIGKFVIPNPFGPLEEFRFTSYLAREWAAGRTPVVGTPLYVRDNIPVSLLAGLYQQFCAALPDRAGLHRCAPSGYVESQGAFAHRLGRAMAPRTGWTCDVGEADQADFAEPLCRINDGPGARDRPAWSEATAWDELAAYYRASFG